MVATKYANFSFLKGKQGGQFRKCFFRLFAAPPVYAHECFSPPFGSARLWRVQWVIFGLRECCCTSGKRGGLGRGALSPRTTMHTHRNCTMNAGKSRGPRFECFNTLFAVYRPKFSPKLFVKSQKSTPCQLFIMGSGDLNMKKSWHVK